jgi:hypothetical protein
MTKARQLLKDLVLDYPWLSIYSIEDGVKKLQGKQKDLEAIHIYIDSLSPKTYPPKKKYFNISRVEALTKLDEWIFDHLINQEEYRRYLQKYLPLKDRLEYEDIDEYILNKHYRPKAIRILSKTRKSFNLQEWTKLRFKYEYKRKTNLNLKDGTPFRFDFRNSLESIFILKKGKDKQILAIGGSGSSGQRLKYTLFTAIFYLLGKKEKIKHYLLRYDSFNRFRYIATYDKPIITWDLGSNYYLNEKLKKEIEENGLELEKVNTRFELC